MLSSLTSLYKLHVVRHAMSARSEYFSWIYNFYLPAATNNSLVLTLDDVHTRLELTECRSHETSKLRIIFGGFKRLNPVDAFELIFVAATGRE